jgi:hypothetical protein
MTIQIGFFDHTSGAAIDTYTGTSALTQLLTENTIDLATLLPENSQPVAFANADTIITTLSTLKASLAQKDPAVADNDDGMISKAEDDLTDDEKSGLETQEHTISTLNGVSMVSFPGTNATVTAPPVGFQDLVELIVSLKAARNEDNLVQISYPA